MVVLFCSGCRLRSEESFQAFRRIAQAFNVDGDTGFNKLSHQLDILRDRIADPRTISPHHLPNIIVVPSLLAEDSTTTGPNQKWAGDISYIWTQEGWLYLVVIIDLYSRRVVGWAVSNRLKKDLAIHDLKMAINLRQSPKGCIHHTDRGSQYCSYYYQKLLKKHGLLPNLPLDLAGQIVTDVKSEVKF